MGFSNVESNLTVILKDIFGRVIAVATDGNNDGQEVETKSLKFFEMFLDYVSSTRSE